MAGSQTCVSYSNSVLGITMESSIPKSVTRYSRFKWYSIKPQTWARGVVRQFYTRVGRYPVLKGGLSTIDCHSHVGVFSMPAQESDHITGIGCFHRPESANCESWIDGVKVGLCARAAKQDKGLQ